MSANNPDITASDIISDVEVRLDNPGRSANEYLPWVSYAYNQVYITLASLGQTLKEQLFGDVETLTLEGGTAEYSIKTNIPRFGGLIKVEVKYGGTSDDWVKATLLKSLANWVNQDNTSTSYRAKEQALYYVLGDNLGFIPTPPESDSGTPQAKVWYIKRPYQLTSVGDVIDLPYRFIFPITNYVHSRALAVDHQDYYTPRVIDANFRQELEMVKDLAESELDEHEGNSVEVDSNSPLLVNPFA